jgi:LysR family glycine cleavage system transcriptional activator
MPRDLLPSMAALTAFESAARHLSFSRAADELHLTQGAVSRQIRQLEDNLGLELFERINQRVHLTDAGRAYLIDVNRILGDLSAATVEVMASAGRADVLSLGVLSTFAARWLVPRLPAFLADHPGATVNLSVRNDPFAFADDPLDAAIHYGEGTWPGAVCEHLCVEESYPVASPAFRDRHRLATPEDLAAAPLLHQSSRPAAWRDWFAGAGLTGVAAFRGPRFDEFAMIAQGAAAGLGAAMMPLFLIERELAAGDLVVLFPEPLNTGAGYWYVYPETKAGSRIVRAFGDWLGTVSRVPAFPPATSSKDAGAAQQ